MKYKSLFLGSILAIIALIGIAASTTSLDIITANSVISAFTGNGAGLTNIQDAALSVNVALRTSSNNFTANNVFTQNGAPLTISSNLISFGTDADSYFKGADTTGRTVDWIRDGVTATRFGTTVGFGGGAIGVGGSGASPAVFVSSGAAGVLAIGSTAASSNGILVSAIHDLSPLPSTTTNIVSLRMWNSNNSAIFIRGTNGVDKLLLAIP